MLSPRAQFVHDVQNRLTVALGFVHLIRNGRCRDNPELLDEYLGTVDDALTDAVDILNSNAAPKREGEARD